MSTDSSEESRVALALKIAKIYRDEIEKADRAMRAFEKVLSIQDEAIRNFGKKACVKLRRKRLPEE